MLSGGIAALASATYGGTAHHRVITYAPVRALGPAAPSGTAPLTDPTLPPTTIAPAPTSSGTRATTPTTSAPVYTTPSTVAPLQSPQYTPQTQPTYQYTPPVVVSGGS